MAALESVELLPQLEMDVKDDLETTFLQLMGNVDDTEVDKKMQEIFSHPEFDPNKCGVSATSMVFWHLVIQKDKTPDLKFSRAILSHPLVDIAARSQCSFGETGLHMVARMRCVRKEDFELKEKKFRVLLDHITEVVQQEDESQCDKHLGDFINAVDNHGFTPAHHLLSEYRSEGLATSESLLQVLLDTQVLEVCRRNNEGQDLLMRAVERLNTRAVELLLEHSKKYFHSCDQSVVGRDSWLFTFAILVKMEFDGVEDDKQERLTRIHELLKDFHYFLERQSGKVKIDEEDVPPQVVADGLSKLCGEPQRRSGQVEMLATALGYKITGVNRSTLLHHVNLRWMEVMRVLMKEERVDLLILISRDPDLTGLLRACTEQEMRELYGFCCTDRTALFSEEGKSSRAGTPLVQIFRQLTSSERRPEVVPRALLFPACHLSFPFICLVLGKFTLVETYFQNFRLPECFPQGVFVAWMSRLLAKTGRGTDRTFNQKLSNIVTVVDDLLCDNIKFSIKGSSVKKQLLLSIFFETPLSCLGDKTMLEVAISGRCGSFLRMRECKMKVSMSEGGTGLISGWRDDDGERSVKQVAVAVAMTTWRIVFILAQPLVQIFKILLLIPCLFVSVIMSPGAACISAVCSNRGQSQCNPCLALIGVPAVVRKIQNRQNKVLKPLVCFGMDLIATAVFLVLISMLVTRYLNKSISCIEACVLVMGGCYMLEGLRKIVYCTRDNTLPKYIKDLWNICDITAFALMLCAACTRAYIIFDDSSQTPFEESRLNVLYWARVFYMGAMLMFYLKFLRIASLWESLGVKLKMIYKMIVSDLLPFLLIIGLVVISFGCCFVGLVYPNGIKSKGVPEVKPGLFVFTQSLLYGFYAMMGEFTVMEDSSGDCTSSSCPHPLSQYFVPLLFLIIFVVLANVLLLNLLIGLFSATIEKVQEQAYELWFTDRTLLKEEFERRSAMPPPLNLPDLLADLLTWCLDNLEQTVRDAGHSREAEGKKMELRKNREEQALILLGYMLAWNSRERKRIVLPEMEEVVEDAGGGRMFERMSRVAARQGLNVEEMLRLLEERGENIVYNSSQ